MKGRKGEWPRPGWGALLGAALAAIAFAPGAATGAGAAPSCSGHNLVAVEIGDPSVHAGGCYDPEGDALTITITSAATKGTVTVSNQGTPFASVRYSATEIGSDSFAFKASDGSSESAEATTTTENVVAVNDPPVCVGNTGMPAEVGEAAVPAGYCSDDENDPLTVTITQQPQKGAATVSYQGTSTPSVRYSATEIGSDSFKFKASDGHADSNEATTTTENVAAVNDPPQCTGMTAMKVEIGDQPAYAGSCYDEENDPLTITITQQPQKGTAAVANQGTPSAYVRYSATDAGADSFAFKASDGSSDSAEATTTTDNIAAVNDPPQCSGMIGMRVEVGEAGVQAGYCQDDERDPLTITITQQPQKGTATVGNQGSPSAYISYSASAAGADSFKFKASDGHADSNEATTTTDNMPATNDPPQCSAGPLTIEVEVGDRYAFTCYDEVGDALTITVSQQPAKGTIELSGQGTQHPWLYYTATAAGADSFTFKASDGSSDSSAATVSTLNREATNDPPHCSAPSSPLEVEIGDPPAYAGYCQDDENDALTITITQQPQKGTATVVDQGTPFASVSYSATQVGAGSFKFEASDGNSESNEVVVATTNTPTTNDPPECLPYPGTTTIELGDLPAIVGYCSDDENDPLTITITQQPQKGTATVVDDPYTLTLGPYVRYGATSEGSDSFKFRASDGHADSNEVTVTTNNVAGTNDPPECQAFFEFQTEVGDLPVEAAYCQDAEGDPLTVTITEQPQKGTTQVVAQGMGRVSVRYGATAAGTDTFKFKAGDGHADSDEVTATTTNLPAENDPPECYGKSGVEAEVGVAGKGAVPCFDAEGDDLTIVVTDQPDRGKLEVLDQGSPQPALRYTATSAGTDSFSYRATDGNAESEVATTTTRNVDTRPPDTTIDTGPSGTIDDATPTFTFSSSEPGSSFECRVDGGSWARCGSPTTLAALGNGPHRFEVRAVDAAGHRDDSPAVHEFTVQAPIPPPPPAEPGPPPVSTPPADTTKPRLLVGGPLTQRVAKTLRLLVTASTEDTWVSVSGTVTVPGRAKLFKLKGVEKRFVARGRKATLTLGVPKTAQNAIRRALRRRVEVTAKLKLQARDAAGNTTLRYLTVKFKR